MSGQNSSQSTQNQQGNTSKGNRLAFHGDRHFTYDERGNLTEERRGTGGRLNTRYTYNSQNQLIQVEKDGQTTHYQYDPLGRRVSKQDEFGTTEFLWNGDVLLSEHRNHKEKVYLYEPNSFKPLCFIENNQCYFYHLDHLGTPQELTNWEGQVVWSAKYKVYGNVIRKDVEQVENNLRFQGQYWDEETGLHYNRHRYYDPSTGQFTQQDPIGLLGGINNYRYAPNPSGWVDPLGLACKELKLSDIDPALAKHLEKLPAGSYRILREVDTPSTGGFANNKAVEIELLDDIKGYRYYGGDAKKEGGFVAIGDLPKGMQAKRQTLALSPFYDEHGKSVYNNMDNIVDVQIGKGSKVLLGEVGPQSSRSGKLYKGGGTQILTQFWLPENAGKVSYSNPKKVK